MDTKDLRFFRQVYEIGSINKAAKQLFITPQGLSKAIRHLEDELDAGLFERSSNGMVPTECGRYLYQRCPHIMLQWEESSNQEIMHRMQQGDIEPWLYHWAALKPVPLVQGGVQQDYERHCL